MSGRPDQSAVSSSTRRYRIAQPNQNTQKDTLIASECMIRLDRENTLRLHDVLVKITSRPKDYDIATELLGRFDTLDIDEVYKDKARQLHDQLALVNIAELAHVQGALVSKSTGHTHDGCKIIGIDVRDTYAIIQKDGQQYRVPLRGNIVGDGLDRQNRETDPVNPTDPAEPDASRSIFTHNSTMRPVTQPSQSDGFSTISETTEPTDGDSSNGSGRTDLEGGCGCSAEPDRRSHTSSYQTTPHYGGYARQGKKDSIVTYSTTSSSAIPGLCE